jgi:hypothetical protein
MEVSGGAIPSATHWARASPASKPRQADETLYPPRHVFWSLGDVAGSVNAKAASSYCLAWCLIPLEFAIHRPHLDVVHLNGLGVRGLVAGREPI